MLVLIEWKLSTIYICKYRNTTKQMTKIPLNNCVIISSFDCFYTISKEIETFYVRYCFIILLINDLFCIPHSSNYFFLFKMIRVLLVQYCDLVSNNEVYFVIEKPFVLTPQP